jgi:hypothetical protein
MDVEPRLERALVRDATTVQPDVSEALRVVHGRVKRRAATRRAAAIGAAALVLMVGIPPAVQRSGVSVRSTMTIGPAG